MKTLEEAIKHWEKVTASQCDKEHEQLAKWLKELQAYRNRAKKVYISAPITGYDLNERDAYFQSIEDELRMKGYDVVNPMKNGLSWDVSHEEHLKRDLELLSQCDEIRFYGKWQKSKGCMIELQRAMELYIPVSAKTQRKVGDKVKIKSKSWYDKYKGKYGILFTPTGFTDGMVNYCGMTGEIVKVFDNFYRINIDNEFWKWDDMIFEDTEEESK